MSATAPNNIYDWKPILNPVFKDKDLANKIHQEGYQVCDWISDHQLSELQNIFKEEHKLNVEEGGMFYSLYSKDLDYRLRVNDRIGAILNPILKEHFKDYKNVVNSFVVKASGPESEFYVHQDTTALDEFNYSPLSLWIPLQDIDANNGALAVIEKTQWFFSPYRGVSFAFPFKNIISTVRRYLKPVFMKKGEVLVFDPRIIHNSLPNNSGENRVAIICGVFQKDAKFSTCFKDPVSESSPIEMYEHEDDYTLQYPNFFYDCHVRPVSGDKVSEVNTFFPDMDEQTFTQLCEENSILPIGDLEKDAGISCNMIAEPDGINKVEPAIKISGEKMPTTKKRSGILGWLKK